MISNILIIFIATISFFLMLYVLHKVRRVHLMQYHLIQQNEIISNNQYHQIQAFISLNQLLKLTWPLPPLRGWAASPDFLLVLAEHALQIKPKTIVECSSGSSTIILAQCAKLNQSGHVFSLEHDKEYAQKTRQELVKQGLETWATVIDAPLTHYEFEEKNYQWYSLNDSIHKAEIDMLVIDGPPGSLNEYARYPAGSLLFKSLKSNATVFLDDSARQEEKKIIKKWMNNFPNLVLTNHYCEKGAISLRNV